MLIQVNHSEKKTSENKVFLIHKNSELDNTQLKGEVVKYFKQGLKDNNFLYTNEAGKFTIVCKSNKLTDDKEKEKVRKFGAQVFELIKNKCKSLMVCGEDPVNIELFSEGLSLASYSFEKYLSENRKTKQVLKTVATANAKADLKGVNNIVEATVWARDLVNEPLSYLTAEQLSDEIKSNCEQLGIKVEVFEKQKIESLKMGGILAVNRGSIDPPTFNILEWKPKGALNKKPIVLVGKGIVYDTGGVSLKPTANSMDFMKSDMGGAATVLGATLSAAKLNLPLHIITLVPATDNRPGVNAYVPGDIITMFDGTTVEVLNTDAEGRLVLADALAYAKKFKPELVIDAATLTGAAARAIGTHAIVAMGNANESEFETLNKAGFSTHDRIVQFPFWDDYFEEMKSPIADLNNLGGPFAGMITAGKFLEHFTDYPYIHLDVAGPAFLHKDEGYRKKGGTGAGVRLLTEFFKLKTNEWKKTN